MDDLRLADFLRSNRQVPGPETDSYLDPLTAGVEVAVIVIATFLAAGLVVHSFGVMFITGAGGLGVGASRWCGYAGNFIGGITVMPISRAGGICRSAAPPGRLRESGCADAGVLDRTCS